MRSFYFIVSVILISETHYGRVGENFKNQTVFRDATINIGSDEGEIIDGKELQGNPTGNQIFTDSYNSNTHAPIALPEFAYKNHKTQDNRTVNVDFHVATVSELNSALLQARSGNVIAINGVIEGSYTVPIGVTLTGGEITGFSDISSGWTQYSGNIYRKAVKASDIKYLQINGTNMRKGRWPNDEWAIIDGSNSKNYLIDADLQKFTNNYFKGAEVVIKVRRYRFNLRIVTEMTGDMITFPSCTYEAEQGYGYFIQNHINCLDREGEWTFDGTYVYLYHSNVNSLIIKVSTRGNGLTLNNGAVLDNVRVTGYNESAIKPIKYGHDQQIRNCYVQYAIHGIYGKNCANTIISGNYIRDIGDSGIDINNTSNIKITNNKLRAIGIYPGYESMGLWGICATFVPSSVISYNDLDSIGYNGIIAGNNSGTKVIGNVVNNYCMLADDGGGIYLGGFTDGLVANNFVQGGRGDLCIASSSWKDYSNKGIYLDGINGNRNVEVRENMCIGSSYNIFLNPSNDITINGNILMRHFAGEELSGLLWSDAGSNHTVKGNLLMASYLGARREAWAHRIRNVPANSVYSDNYYLLPLGQLGGTNDVILRYLVPLSAQEWMNAGYGINEHSDLIVWNESMNVSSEEFIDYDYNFSEIARSYDFKSGYDYYNPLTGGMVSSLLLQPYQGMILYKVKKSGSGITTITQNTFSNVHIYPNPASEILIIDIMDNPEITFELFNNNGVLLLKEKLSEKVSLINIRELPKGIYTLKTMSNNTYHTEKVILQ